MRLIDADALKEAFREAYAGITFSLIECNDLIDNAPIVTPQAFYNGIVEIISKNGITTVDELLETLKGGKENG